MNENTLNNVMNALEIQGAYPQERGKEIVTHCIFSGCDNKRKSSQLGRLYISIESGAYWCHRCEATGSINNLRKQLGMDNKSKVNVRRRNASNNYKKYQDQLILSVRTYLENRKISKNMIQKFGLGYGSFYKASYITIPVFNEEGIFQFMKLRCFPENQENAAKYMNYPKGAKVSLYGLDKLDKELDYVVICEGEFDCMQLHTNGINAVTSTGGAKTFKEEWLHHFRDFQYIYIWFDNDLAGQEGAEKVIRMLVKASSDYSIHKIGFPEEFEGKDITDYVSSGGDISKFMQKIRNEKEEILREGDFSEIGLDDIREVLNLTIKKDDNTKLMTFIGMLSALSEDDPMNILLNAPSSAGKTYIPLQIAKLFPRSNVISLAYTSPMAFFHDSSIQKDKDGNKFLNLEHKIIIFLDSPHTQLLERLRPILSHDEKEMIIKIADKVKGSLNTKTITVRGYPAVVFCTVDGNIDDQELTRFITLSPEMTTEKIKASMQNSIDKASNPDNFRQLLLNNPKWQSLRKRILMIKKSGVTKIVFDKETVGKNIIDSFDEEMLQLRDQREISRMISTVKVFALLNYMHRERISKDTIKATDADVTAVTSLWLDILKTQQLGVSPHVYSIYRTVLVPLANGKKGVTLREINQKHFELYKKAMTYKFFMYTVASGLEYAGLLERIQDPTNKRTYRYIIKEK